MSLRGIDFLSNCSKESWRREFNQKSIDKVGGGYSNFSQFNKALNVVYYHEGSEAVKSETRNNRPHLIVVGVIAAATAGSIFYTQTSFAGGIITSTTTKGAIAAIAGAAAGGAAGGAVIGTAGGGPVGTGLGAAAGAVTLAVGAATTLAVTQAEKHPVAAIQTVIATNPITAPSYIFTHPSSIVKGIKDVWKYLF